MDQKKALKLSIIVLIVIFIIMITILTIIWEPAKKEEEKVSFDGRKKAYSYIDNEKYQSKTIEIYKPEIQGLLFPTNYLELFKNMDKTFIEKNNLNEANFKNYLEKNKLISNKIVFKNFSVIQRNSEHIYRLTYNNLNNSGEIVSNCTINIIEQKPYTYTLSFEDNILNLLKHDRKRTVDNIEFDIKNTENKKNSAKFEIKITNNNTSSIDVNFDDINNIILELSDGKHIKMAAAVISSDTEILTTGSSIKKEAFFNVNLEEQSKIKAIKFNNVKIGNEIKLITVNF